MALIRFIVVIFILLLAVYIPLKIYINREEGLSHVEQQVSFDMMVTRNLSCTLSRPAGEYTCRQRIGEIIENHKPSLLIDYTEISSRLLKEAPGRENLPLEKLRNTGYHAVAPVIADRNSMEALSGAFWLLRLPLPLTSANIVPGSESGNNLRQLIITDIEAKRAETGKRRDIKAGIFSISLADSIQPEYSRFNKYNIINPKIAALEVINRLKREGCHIVIAVCGPGGEKELLELPGIDIILEKAGKPGFSYDRGRVTVRFGGEDLPVDIFRVSYSVDSIGVSRVEY